MQWIFLYAQNDGAQSYWAHRAKYPLTERGLWAMDSSLCSEWRGVRSEWQQYYVISSWYCCERSKRITALMSYWACKAKYPLTENGLCVMDSSLCSEWQIVCSEWRCSVILSLYKIIEIYYYFLFFKDCLFSVSSFLLIFLISSSGFMFSGVIHLSIKVFLTDKLLVICSWEILFSELMFLFLAL